MNAPDNRDREQDVDVKPDAAEVSGSSDGSVADQHGESDIREKSDHPKYEPPWWDEHFNLKPGLSYGPLMTEKELDDMVAHSKRQSELKKHG